MYSLGVISQLFTKSLVLPELDISVYTFLSLKKDIRPMTNALSLRYSFPFTCPGSQNSTPLGSSNISRLNTGSFPARRCSR